MPSGNNHNLSQYWNETVSPRHKELSKHYLYIKLNKIISSLYVANNDFLIILISNIFNHK